MSEKSQPYLFIYLFIFGHVDPLKDRPLQRLAYCVRYLNSQQSNVIRHYVLVLSESSFEHCDIQTIEERQLALKQGNVTSKQYLYIVKTNE